MEEQYQVPREEQETIINIDYYDKTISLYTNRKAIANNLEKVLGEPNSFNTVGGKKCDVTYKRPLSSEDVKLFFSKGRVIGQVK